MNIYELVDDVLDGLSVPYAAVQFLTASPSIPLPDLFLVSTIITNMPEETADDEEVSRFYRVQISVYNRSGLTGLPDVDAAMKAAGFKKSDRRELPIDRETGHYGLALDYTILLDAGA